MCSRRRSSGPNVVGLSLIAGLLLSGCASVLQGVPPGDNGTGGTGSPTYEHGSGADDVLISISGPDGLVSLETALRHTTEFLLLGDGTAIVPGVVDMIYPGPAIYPLQSATLDEEQIQALLRAADDAGLLSEQVDYGAPEVVDVSNTNVTINVDGRSYWQSAYGLGVEEEATVSDAQRQARTALRTFIETARGVVSADSEQYVPTAVIAFGLSSDAAPPPGADMQQEPLAWPISSVPTVPESSSSGVGTCAEVTGDEVPVLLAALAEANALTPWRIGTDPPSRIEFRPLLPGDPGCG